MAIGYEQHPDLGRCVGITNDEVKLLITVDVGPRVLFYGRLKGENVFAELPIKKISVGTQNWAPLGGHRFWTSPEHVPGSYTTDDAPVFHEMLDAYRIHCRQAPQATNGMEKQITIELDEHGSAVMLHHTLINRTPWHIEAAPWALSIMRSGGEAILPQEPYRSHAKSVLPARAMALWAYTDLSDQRFSFGSRYIRLRCDTRYAEPQKIGIANRPGWLGYRLDEDFFLKKAEYFDNATYPDLGSSAEVFTAGDFIELETLGPLIRLEPGESCTHTEHWRLAHYTPRSSLQNDAELNELLVALFERDPSRPFQFFEAPL